MQVLQRVLADVLTRAVTHHQQLDGRHPAAANARHQRLRHDGRQRQRQLLANGVLPLVRERIADAADVAKYGYDAMMNGKRLAIPGIKNKILAQANRLAPRSLSAKIARIAQESR